MKPEIKALWLEALRSGKYRKGIGYLHQRDSHNHHKFCCLGVLCEIAIENGVELIKTPGPDLGIAGIDIYAYDSEEGVLPKQVADWAGLVETDPFVSLSDKEGRKYQVEISGVNDRFGYGFKKLADLIEEQL